MEKICLQRGQRHSMKRRYNRKNRRTAPIKGRGLVSPRGPATVNHKAKAKINVPAHASAHLRS